MGNTIRNCCPRASVRDKLRKLSQAGTRLQGIFRRAAEGSFTMKRREFVASSLAASAMASLTANVRGSQGATGAPREYYHLLVWRLRRGPQTKLLDDFLRQAA